MTLKYFTQLVKGKSTKALIELFELGQSGKQRIDPDFLNIIIEELSSRELAGEEMKAFDSLMSLSSNEVFESANEIQTKFSEDELAKILKVNQKEERDERNSTLIVSAEVISILAILIVIVGIVLFILIAFNEQLMLATQTIVNYFITALFVYILSKLIPVFVDIETNTRKQV